MNTIFRSLLLVIAGATQRELARQIKYLKVENELLRSRLPQRLTVTPRERVRLVKFAQQLTAKMLHALVSIVHPETLLRWGREARRTKPKREPVPRGRPRTPEQLRKLIRKLARENDWGYTRIMGELKKLNIQPPSRNTVKNILKAVGLDPGPQRGEQSWDEFLKRHAASLWQCDFFSRNVLTPKGLRQAFVLAFVHVKTRRVILSPACYRPTAAWMVEQAETFVQQARDAGLRVGRVMHDRDKMFSSAFTQTLRRRHVKRLRTPFRAPNTNAYIERFIQSIEQECLDHFIVFGTSHLDVLCREYLAYYLTERPHQGRDNTILVPAPGNKSRKKKPLDDGCSLREIRCRSRLGGLLKHYERRAA